MCLDWKWSCGELRIGDVVAQVLAKDTEGFAPDLQQPQTVGRQSRASAVDGMPFLPKEAVPFGMRLRKQLRHTSALDIDIE